MKEIWMVVCALLFMLFCWWIGWKIDVWWTNKFIVEPIPNTLIIETKTEQKEFNLIVLNDDGTTSTIKARLSGR